MSICLEILRLQTRRVRVGKAEALPIREIFSVSRSRPRCRSCIRIAQGCSDPTQRDRKRWSSGGAWKCKDFTWKCKNWRDVLQEGQGTVLRVSQELYMSLLACFSIAMLVYLTRVAFVQAADTVGLPEPVVGNQDLGAAVGKGTLRHALQARMNQASGRSDLD